jgi:hypothetical protein
MKNWIFLFFLFLLQSCWICPDSHNIEYDKKRKILKVLDEGYALKSVRIFKYNNAEGYLKYTDSNSISLNLETEKIDKTVNLISPGKNYKIKKPNIQSLLEEDSLDFYVVIARSNKISNEEYIHFISTELENEKTSIKSAGGCK